MTPDSLILDNLTAKKAWDLTILRLNYEDRTMEAHARSLNSVCTEMARMECRAHSLIHNGRVPIQKTWTKVASAYGVSAWGYEPAQVV